MEIYVYFQKPHFFFKEVVQVFVSFSQVFRRIFEVFGLAGTCSDLLGPVRMHSDASGCVRMHSDTFGTFGKKLPEKSVFRIFGEVFEELCQQLRPKGLPPIVFRGPGDLIL